MFYLPHAEYHKHVLRKPARIGFVMRSLFTWWPAWMRFMKERYIQTIATPARTLSPSSLSFFSSLLNVITCTLGTTQWNETWHWSGEDWDPKWSQASVVPIESEHRTVLSLAWGRESLVLLPPCKTNVKADEGFQKISASHHIFSFHFSHTKWTAQIFIASLQKQPIKALHCWNVRWRWARFREKEFVLGLY